MWDNEGHTYLLRPTAILCSYSLFYFHLERKTEPLAFIYIQGEETTPITTWLLAIREWCHLMGYLNGVGLYALLVGSVLPEVLLGPTFGPKNIFALPQHIFQTS